MRRFHVSWVRSWWRRQRRPARPAYAHRPRLEHLESRWAPAIGGTPNQNFVQQVYQDVLHRQASSSDLAFWVPQLDSNSLSRFQVAFGIESSSEGLSTYVNDSYLRFLGRAADAQGLSFWTNYLSQNNGNTGAAGTGQSNTTAFHAQLLASDEFFAAHGSNNSGFLTAVYQDVLCRTPDSTAQSVWLPGLNNNSLSRQQLALNLLQSDEGRQDQAQEFYNSYLHRTGESSGVVYWISTVQQNQFPNRNLAAAPNGGNANLTGNRDMELEAEFLGSPEYFQNAQTLLAPATFPGCTPATTMTTNMFAGIPVPFNGTLSDVVLFNQAPITQPPVVSNLSIANTSMVTPPFGTYTNYDKFTVTSSAAINFVTWEGAYFGPGTTVPISEFHIAFYIDAGNMPGAQIGTTEVIPFANAHETNLHNEVGFTGATVLVADYSATLPTPFFVQANTPYWMSIVAVIPNWGSSQPTQWGWHIGTGTDKTSVQDAPTVGALPGGRLVKTNGDVAFSLVVKLS